MHDLSSWSYTTGPETENSTESSPTYGTKTDFTPVYKGSVSTSGSTAKFNFTYKYNVVSSNSSSDESYYYTSSNSSIEESYWSGVSTVGSPATSTCLYQANSTSSEAYDLSVEKTSSYLNLIYSTKTSQCQQKVDAFGSVCGKNLTSKNWGHWDVGTYDVAMIGPADQREALYNVLKDTSWKEYSATSENTDTKEYAGNSTSDIITFSDNFNYAKYSLTYWGGNYYYVNSSENLAWSASPNGHLVLATDAYNYKFYDILYQTDSSSSDQKYQVYFDKNLYPSSDDSVTAQGIGTWLLSYDSSYVSESLLDTYFRYNYKPTSKKTLINKTDEIYSDETKFKGNAYANKKAFVSEKQWYYQAGIWTASDGTKFECTGLKSSTQMQQYSLTYGSTTYKVSNVADLGSNKYIVLASYRPSGSIYDAYDSFILEDKLDGTFTLVSTADESDSSKVKTLNFKNHYGYDESNYVEVTIGAEKNLLSKSVGDIVKIAYSDYDYTISDSSVTVNLFKTATVNDVVSKFNSYTSLKTAQTLIVKAGSSGSTISNSATLESNNNIYFATEKDSSAFYATYKIADSVTSTFTEPTFTVNYDCELSEDKKSLKVLVIPETNISSCVESYIKNLSGEVTYSYTDGYDDEYNGSYPTTFRSAYISSDITITVSFETYSDLPSIDDDINDDINDNINDGNDDISYDIYYNDEQLGVNTLSVLELYYALEEDEDYTVDESTLRITLTESGYEKYSMFQEE